MEGRQISGLHLMRSMNGLVKAYSLKDIDEIVLRFEQRNTIAQEKVLREAYLESSLAKQREAGTRTASEAAVNIPGISL